MGYTAIIDDEHDADIASNQGWRDFTALAESFPDMDETHHLIYHGWTDDLAALAVELREIIHGNNGDASAKSVAQGLLEFVDANKDGEIITVTNGEQ